MIKRIEICGFRGIPTRLEIPFLNGKAAKSLILYGRNGTGKSSITDAWEWFTSGKILHLAREGAEESAYPHMTAKPGSTYVEVEFVKQELGVVRLTFDSKRMRTPKISGDLDAVRKLVAHPCHVRHADLTRFVLLTKSDRYDALASLMGFVPQMEYQKGLRRIAEKLNSDLTGQRAIFTDTKSRYERHFLNEPGETLTPQALLARRCVAHAIPCDGTPDAIVTAAEQLKQLVVADQNAKRLAAIRGMKTSLNGFTPATGLGTKIKTLRAAVGELKATHVIDRDKILRIPFLQSAERMLAKVPSVGQCPLCHQNFTGDLKKHVTDELTTLQRLEGLLTRVRVAKDTLNTGLVDHSIEEPVTIPEKYNAPKNLVDSLATFQARVKVWKTSIAASREVLNFDTSALTDELIASMLAAESTIEKANTELLATKKALGDLLEGMIVTLEKDPLRKKLVDDNEYVVQGLRLIDELKTSKDKGVAIRAINDRFTTLVDRFVEMALKDVNERFDQISTKVTDFFGTLEKHTPGIGAPKLKLDTTQDRSVVLEVEFQNTTISPAYRYLSESQLNSFGLAVSLASATHFNRDFPFLILDDVVNSCDAYKRPQLIDLIVNHLRHVQVLLMTHDTFWRDLLHKRLNQWNRLNFLRYDLGAGPVHEPGKDTYARLQEELDRDEANAAAARLASYLEDAAQEIGEAIEINVKFNRRGDYTLDPLLTSIRAKLESKLGGTHPLVQEMNRITQDNAYRNWGIHCKNPVSSITTQEIATVVTNWKAIESKLYCPHCSEGVKADGSQFRCRCGSTVLQKLTV